MNNIIHDVLYAIAVAGVYGITSHSLPVDHWKWWKWKLLNDGSIESAEMSWTDSRRYNADRIWLILYHIGWYIADLADLVKLTD